MNYIRLENKRDVNANIVLGSGLAQFRKIFPYSLAHTSFHKVSIDSVMQIFLYDLWTVYSSDMSQMETNDNAARIFLRFLSLVQKDCRQQRDVAYYADKLCITSKYLSQVSRSVSGLPASEWITYYATFELVSLLNDQSKTLTEVADLMNFETASHFSRYVKKILGKSPSQYREK